MLYWLYLTICVNFTWNLPNVSVKWNTIKDWGIFNFSVITEDNANIIKLKRHNSCFFLLLRSKAHPKYFSFQILPNFTLLCNIKPPIFSCFIKFEPPWCGSSSQIISLHISNELTHHWGRFKVVAVISVGYMQLSPMFPVINFALYFLKKEKEKIGVDAFAWLNSDLSCWLSSPLEETAFHT